eukprot:jgi/Psemu1/30501/gm1.30501_g
MPEGTWTEESEQAICRRVTPDTGLDTTTITEGEREIQQFQKQLNELTKEVLGIVSAEISQQHRRLLLEYTEDSDDDSDGEMSKKKDLGVLKDHLEESQMKPIMILTSIDVYHEFTKTLTNALAEVSSTKYIQGGGYVFLLETVAQYWIRDQDQEAIYPVTLSKPPEISGMVELTSDTYQAWKRNRVMYMEWNKYNCEALILTDKKFPNMLDKLKDPPVPEALPKGTTALEAFQSMKEDLCSTDTQRELTAELTKKMINLGEYFRQLIRYQHQINLLMATATMTEAQMIDYAHLVFKRSKHDPMTLNQVEDEWKDHQAAHSAGASTDNSKRDTNENMTN